MGFNLEEYETVAERLKRWWDAYPAGAIVTTMVHYDGQTVVFRAEGFAARDEERPIAVGFAEEVLNSSPVNKTSFVENAETSAVGRMIGNSPLGSGDPAKRASREEMAKVERRQSVQHGDVTISQPANLATDKQLGLIRRLCKELGRTVPNDLQSYDKRRASELIERLNGIKDGAIQNQDDVREAEIEEPF